jgi:hypothetical protein
MRILQDRWTIQKLHRQEETINLNPRFQRGAAWQNSRQVLLIDSVLRGMDIPKIYLRKLPAGGAHTHDTVDGQQRLRAIFSFRASEYSLRYTDPLPQIDGHNVHDLRFTELHKTLRDRFDAFEVAVAEIVQATPDEISSLFSRLQMGVSLNPAELRNAMGGPLQHLINVIAETHEFFTSSRISGSRYKKADYAALLFAIAAYRGRCDLKAPDLKRMIAEYGPDRSLEILELATEVGDALNVLAAANKALNYRLTQKWVVLDLTWLIMQRQRAGRTIDPSKLANAYTVFDERRLEFNSKPEILIRGRRRDPALDRHLYNYISAFRIQGGLAANVHLRAEAITAFHRNVGVSF